MTRQWNQLLLLLSKRYKHSGVPLKFKWCQEKKSSRNLLSIPSLMVNQHFFSHIFQMNTVWYSVWYYWFPETKRNRIPLFLFFIQSINCILPRLCSKTNFPFIYWALEVIRAWVRIHLNLVVRSVLRKGQDNISQGRIQLPFIHNKSYANVQKI